ncbi:MAG: hypothetical protein ACREJC_00665 [Tepidisphaeraceae bacterium]
MFKSRIAGLVSRRWVLVCIVALACPALPGYAALVVTSVVVKNESAQFEADTLRLVFDRNIVPAGMNNQSPLSNLVFPRGNRIQKINAPPAAPTNRGSFKTPTRRADGKYLDLFTPDDEAAMPAAIKVRKTTDGPDQTRVDVLFDNVAGTLVAPGNNDTSTNYYNAGVRINGAARVLMAQADFRRDPNTGTAMVTISGDRYGAEFFHLTNVEFWTNLSDAEMDDAASVLQTASDVMIPSLDMLNSASPLAPNQSLTLDLGPVGDATYVLMSYDLAGSMSPSSSMSVAYGESMLLSGSVSVPEPGSLWLGAVGGTILLRRRVRW